MSDLASTSEKAVRAALDKYDAALKNREHGGVAAHRMVGEVRAALASPAPAESGEPVGYVFLNPDTGIEFSVNHPVESGEVDDAQDIRHATEFEAELVRQLNNAVATISTLRETVAGSHRDYQSAWTRAEEAEEKLRSAHPPAESAGSPSTSGVGVKRLEWSEPSPPNEYCHYNHTFADTPFGRYQIEWKGWKDNPGFTVELSSNHVPIYGGTLEHSMALVQAAYEARIRSALVYQSDPSRDTQPALLSTDERKEGGNG